MPSFLIEPLEPRLLLSGAPTPQIEVPIVSQAETTMQIVTPVNNAPTGTDQTRTINEDTIFTFAATDFGFADVDGDALGAVRIDSLTLPTGATLQLDTVDVTAGQVIAVADLAVLVFRPAPNANGANYASFTFSVRDTVLFDTAPNWFTFNVTAVNDRPSGADRARTINEDTSYTFVNAASEFGFVDIDGDALGAVRIDNLLLPVEATLQLNGADVTARQVIAAGALPTLVFTPAPNANGQNYALFTFSVRDGSLFDLVPNSFTFHVTAVNDAPAVNDQTFSVTENSAIGTVVGMILATDVDANTTLAYAVTGGTGQAAFAVNPATGEITVANQALLDFEATPSFILDITISDSGAPQLTDTAVITINLTNVNEAPTAANDGPFVVTRGTTLTASAPGVLGNDTDIDSLTLSAILVSGPANGTLTLNPDGSFSYTNNGSAVTTDSFTYKANDGLLDSNSATVSFTVLAQATGTVTGVKFHDRDQDGIRDAGEEGLAGWTIFLDTNSNALLDAGESNTVTDAEGRYTLANLAPGAFRVHEVVQPGWRATVDDCFDVTIVAGQTATQDFANFLAAEIRGTKFNDVNGNGVRDTGEAGLADWTIFLDMNGNGVFDLLVDPFDLTTAEGAYALVNLFPGTYRVREVLQAGWEQAAPAAGLYTVTLLEGEIVTGRDFGNVQNAAPVVTVQLLNDTRATSPVVLGDPVGAPNDRITKDVALTGRVSDNVAVTSFEMAFNDNGGPLVTFFDILPRVGPDGVFTLTETDINLITGKPIVQYLHQFAFRARDAAGNSTEVIFAAERDTIAPGALRLDLLPISDTGASDSDHVTADNTPMAQVTLPDRQIVIRVFLNGVEAPGLSPIGVNLGPTEPLVVTGEPPIPLADGMYLLTTTVEDVAGNVAGPTPHFTLTIDTMAPTSGADAYQTEEDTALVVTAANGVLKNDTDATALTAQLVSGPAQAAVFTLNPDGSFSYTPTANFHGTDQFRYRVVDLAGNVGTDTLVTLTINPVNDAPVANPQSVTTAEDTAKSITLTGADVENDPLTFSIVTGPTHGTLMGTGATRLYTPDLNYFGPDSFTFKVNDGQLDSNIATVTITVTAVNDRPVGVADAFTVDEGGLLTVGARGVLINDLDVDNVPAELTATLVVGSGPQFGVLQFNTDGSLTYTHDGSEALTDSFKYRVFDGIDFSEAATVTITVNPVNDMPVITSLHPTTATVGVRYTYDVDAFDPDPGDVLTFSLRTFPAGMTINATTGLIEWTPTHGQKGTQTVTVRVKDRAGSFKEQRFTIAVAEVVCNGDLDGDGDVDLNDLNVILAARNTKACGPNDCRDVDGDGRITVLDARQWVLKFLH